MPIKKTWSPLAILFVLGHTLMNTTAQVFYKLSSESGGVGSFALWQLIGNTAATLGVLSYTMSMRWLPLHVAYPLTQGLAVLGVSIIGAWGIFQETISGLQWLGILLVSAGIVLISIGKPSSSESPVLETTAG